MRGRKNSVTKRGGGTPRKNDILANTFKTQKENEVCEKGGRGPFTQKK